jgi:rubredoxin
MERYICTNCGYVYDPLEGDPERGIAPGTPFDELPEEWVCPVCYVTQDRFDPL